MARGVFVAQGYELFQRGGFAFDASVRLPGKTTPTLARDKKPSPTKADAAPRPETPPKRAATEGVGEAGRQPRMQDR